MYLRQSHFFFVGNLKRCNKAHKNLTINEMSRTKEVGELEVGFLQKVGST